MSAPSADISKFSVLIPARLNSTRLPNKPLLDICGEPMIVHVARQAHKSLAKQVIVATDSKRILSVCEKFNIEAYLTSRDNKNGTERIAEVVKKMHFRNTDIVVNVQGDEPLIDPKLINSVAKKLSQFPSCNIATAASIFNSIHEIISPHTVKVVTDKFGFASYFSRAPIPYPRSQSSFNNAHECLKKSKAYLHRQYYQHIGIYAYRVKFLKKFVTLDTAPTEEAESLEQLRALWHGEKIAVLCSKKPSAGGVDTQQDYEKILSIISLLYVKKQHA